MPQPRLLTNDIHIRTDGVLLPVNILALLMSAVVDQHTHLPAMFSLEFKDPDLDLVDNTIFNLGTPVTISVGDDFGQQTTLIKGEITALEPVFDQAEAPRLIVSGYDKSHRLYRNTRTRAYLNMKDSNIAEQIARENGLASSVEETNLVYEHIIQDNQSDLAFLMQRAWRIGFECYLEDDKLHFRKPSQSNSGLTLKRDQDLLYFRPRLTVAEQVNQVLVQGWAADEQKPIVGLASKGSLYPENGMESGAVQAQKVGGAGKMVIVDQPVVNQTEANLLAQARLDEISGAFIEAEGVALIQPSLRAGKTVKLEGLGERFSGTYMVTSARHVYNNRFLKTTFTVRGTRTGTLTEQSLRQEPLSRWPGVVTAVVTNITDPKNQGRVKVKFPWMDDATESSWARVVSVGAGPEAGLACIPQVNDEVLVAFEHGDFNNPFVLGGLWSAKHKPPRPTMDAQNTERASVRTWRSLKGHFIAMHETSKEKKIEITTAAGHKILLDDNNNLIELKSAGGYKVALNEKGQKIEVIHPVGQKVTLESSKIAVEGNAVVEVKSAGKLSLEASGMIDIKAGGPVNIKGAVVNIN